MFCFIFGNLWTNIVGLKFENTRQYQLGGCSFKTHLRNMNKTKNMHTNNDAKDFKQD